MDYGVQSTNLNLTPSVTSDIDWSTFIFYAVSAAIFLIIILIILRILRAHFAKNQYLKQTVFLVRLPKEKPGEENKEATVQDLREQISVGESIFNSIGGARAQKGLKAWLFGRQDHYSFEIVAADKKIYFYVVAPADNARYIEQQIHAHYPDAMIEEVSDYNIFNPAAKVNVCVMKTKKSFVFPIRTYNKMEIDPMNSLVSVMSKLEKDESMALQVLVRSARGHWHHKISSVVRQVNRGKKVSEAVGGGVFNSILSFLGSVAREAKPKSERDKEVPEKKKLSAMEEEMLKNMEDKNAKAGLDVNIRIIVSTANEHNGKAYLLNMANAFAEYNSYEYGNIFKQKTYKFGTNVIHDFIYRRFSEKNSFLLNTEELNSIYHFPLKTLETPNIAWLTARQAPAPANLPDEGIVLGKNYYRGVERDIRIKRADRRRHSYIIGKSGTGKSKFISGMAVQDILNGEGVCIMDPHGDLIEDVLSCIPPERAEDVIVFSPADMERPMGLNLIEFDERYPEQKTFVINELIKIFDKLYDLKTTGGPMFEQYMRNALLLIMSHVESGSTLMEIPRVLSDPDFRKMKLEHCTDITVVDFWRKQAEKAGGEAALANIVPYITSKLTQFVSNDTMRPIIGQQKSSFNLRDVMDKQKILLIDLSKGKIGDMNAYLLGLILVGKMLMAALSRADMPDSQRKDFYLYIDEFQNFTTDSINTILSEARKYGLNLIIAHQYLGQLGKEGETIRSAVFGNVGSWFTFKIGTEDAEVLAKEYSPVFNEYDLINIEARTAYVKLLVDGTATRPFSMKTLNWPPEGSTFHPGLTEKIKTLSRLKYGRDRALIEAEVNKRLTMF
jgi:hypothetical protein